VGGTEGRVATLGHYRQGSTQYQHKQLELFHDFSFDLKGKQGGMYA
jgi:hypothetical protein